MPLVSTARRQRDRLRVALGPQGLETIKNTSGWNWPGRKDKPDHTVDERWVLIRAAMKDQASGAMLCAMS